MSAFMVGATHVHALVTAGLILTRPYGPLSWYWGDPRKARELNELTQDDVGRMLMAENCRSINYRYGEEEPAPEYSFKMLPGLPDPVIVLKAIRCYVYQSCETDDWEKTEAAAFCESLTVTAIRCLPGYDEAPAWGIRDPFVFWNKVVRKMAKGLPHILMCGNPTDGFRFVGPFDDGTEAIEYAESDPEHSLAGRDWWVIPLDAPAGKGR